MENNESGNNQLKGYIKKKVFRKESKEDKNKEIRELSRLLKEGKTIIGTEIVIKLIKKGEIKEVYVSQNVDELTFKKLEHYSKISNFVINKIELRSSELAEKLGKPFNISIIGIKKESAKKKK